MKDAYVPIPEKNQQIYTVSAGTIPYQAKPLNIAPPPSAPTYQQYPDYQSQSFPGSNQHQALILPDPLIQNQAYGQQSYQQNQYLPGEFKDQTYYQIDQQGTRGPRNPIQWVLFGFCFFFAICYFCYCFAPFYAWLF